MFDIDWLHEPTRATTRILFARHGEYTCNLTNTCNCDPRTAYHLTDKGRQQALDLGESLRNEGIEIVISSAFLRGRQTAWLVNQALGLPIVVNSLANENRVGSALEGRTNVEFRAMIRADPANTAAVDGESFVAMKARIFRLMLELQRGSSRTVLVITHGWPMQAVRVLQGQLDDSAGALCEAMPGNCNVVAGTLRGERFA